AWEIIEEIATTFDDERQRVDLLRRMAEILPSSRPHFARQRQGKLTTRERDVALLVARGLSNRAIADQLSIGERTVETHVSNLLGKLGFQVRTQIATWVMTANLNEPVR